MLKKLRRKVYRKIRFQTWYRKAYYYHRKRRDLDKTIAQYRGVDVLSDKKRLYRLRRDMIRSLFRYGSYYNDTSSSAMRERMPPTGTGSSRRASA